jgi:hypothetical protein
MIENFNSINDWAYNSLKGSFKENGFSDFCLAYVSSVLEEYTRKKIDHSIVLFYSQTVENPSFEKYQNLGDTCFIQEIISKENSHVRKFIAEKSYDKCYKYSLNKLDIYRELSFNFENITLITKKKLYNLI